MKVTAYDVLGNFYIFDPVSEMKLTKKALECYDSLYVCLPLVKTLGELELIEVEDNDENLIFAGQVDFHTASFSPEGRLTKVWARSFAAALDDNEAVPKLYPSQSASDIFFRHAAPYGMVGYKGNNVTLPGTFVVAVGDSEWRAIVNFCRQANGYYPRVSGMEVDFGPFDSPGSIHFSNDSSQTDVVAFARANIQTNRKRVISNVLTRNLASEDFEYNIPARGIEGRFIQRRRVMRYQNTSQNQKYNLAQLYMDRARASSKSASVMLDGYRKIPLRTKAAISDSVLGSVTGYAVAEVIYHLDHFFERTEILMWPEGDIL